jgi:hypothetical protein
MQGKRTHAVDSRGRRVPGLYLRDGKFIAGFKLEGRWTMRTLAAETLTVARREREGLLAGIRDGRIPAPAAATFEDVFAEHQASALFLRGHRSMSGTCSSGTCAT